MEKNEKHFFFHFFLNFAPNLSPTPKNQPTIQHQIAKQSSKLRTTSLKKKIKILLKKQKYVTNFCSLYISLHNHLPCLFYKIKLLKASL